MPTKVKKMSPDDKKRLISAAWRVWEVVASDALAGARECNERLTNADIRELVLDADYMLTYANLDASSLGYSYNQLLNALKGERFV